MTEDQFFGRVKEQDPHGKSAKEPGSKLDAGKVALFQGLIDYFPRACEAVAAVSTFGARKYAWKGWEEVPDGINRYSNAEMRHKIERARGEVLDKESAYLHEAHEAWNMMAVLELRLREIEPERAN